MIEENVFEAYNNRLVSITELKKLTPSQADRVKNLGSSAENLLKNKEFILFVRQFQLETMDAIVNIGTHTADNNSERIALGNQLNGMDSFINLLKRQVVLKNRLVSEQNKSVDPNIE